MRSIHRVLPIVAVLVFATGCAGSDEKAPPTTSSSASEAQAEGRPNESPASTALPDACALVTKADAEKLAGTSLEDAVPVRESCMYTGPVTGPTAQVEIYVGDGAKKMLDIDRDLQHDFIEVASIGDEAHMEDGAVFFRKSGVWVAIRLVLLNDPAENRKPLETAARTASERM